jgi:hypothetical protein
MDADRFDTLTRRIGSRTSRRVAVGLAAAGLLGIAVPEPVAARCRRATSCDPRRFPTCHNSIDCRRVKNVDSGRCACIHDSCGPQCRTGSECPSKLCVFAKGCCTDTGKWCASPCPD